MNQEDADEPRDTAAQDAGSPVTGDDASASVEGGDNETADPQGETNLEEALAAATRERDNYYDRLLRKSAEFDNYRKRVERDRREQIEWAAADLLSEIIKVLDDFERALQADAPPEAAPYRAGVELLHRQLSELVRKRGATPIEALGADFDPNLHQAVAYEETPGAREGEVVAEFAKGYKLGDRLLRPAMVKVAKAS
jgi:molecular chaperone GrpE